MDKLKVFVLITTTILVIILIQLIFDKNKIKSQVLEISNLETKVESLQKKVSDLENEKEELEIKVTQLNAIDNSFNSSSSNSDFQNPSPSLYNSSIQTVNGNGYAVVVYKQSSCDYFILENNSGYIIAEWMGGNDPDQGDKITGSFNSFGTKEFYNQSRDRECRLWVDDYMLSKESALDKIRDKCN
jgi:hypothetical protein